METVIIDAGTLTANKQERIVTGLLLPYGEECRSNLGRFSFERGTVELPTDLTGMSFNTEHEREKVIGAPVSLTDTAAGVVATFKIAATPAGDQALDDIATGKRKHLSAEVADVKIKDGKGIAGRLFAAAHVAEPAFPSATLLAAAADTPEVALPTPPAPGGDPTETTTTNTDEVEDEAGVKHKRTTTTTTKAETDADGNSKTTITTVEVIEEPGAQAPGDTTNTDTKEGTAVGVPNTLTASKAETTTETKLPSLQTIFASIAALRTNPQDADAHTLLAALSDIKISGAGALPAAGVLRENWVGQLYQGIPYERQYITLGNLGTDISAAGKKGYRVHRGTTGAPVDTYAPQATWAGNKAQIPSGTGFTETAASTLRRFAFGEDIAREFYDLPGGAEVVEAFLKLIAEDYLIWSDTNALADWVTAAGAPIAPSADIPTDYNGTLGMLIQGILAVKAKKADNRRDKPSFAILNEAAFEELNYTPFEKIPEYIKFSVSTDGTGVADGDVQVLVGDIGIEDSPAVLVGAKSAIEFDELAGGPLQIDALNIAQGGIDKAVHGYLQTFPVRSEAVVLVGEADA